MSSCGYCSKSSRCLLKCACGTEWYCDKKCQKLDWKTHKKDCPPFVIKEVGQMGRGLIATRNLPRGACVLKENAVLALDRKLSDDDQERLMRYELLKLTPEIQAQILDLHDPEDKKMDRDMGAKVKRIVQKNHLDVEGEIGTTFHLFLNSSMINHSCNPNSEIVAGSESEFEPKQCVKVITYIDIKKGEEITVNYYFSRMEAFLCELGEFDDVRVGYLKYHERQQIMNQRYKFYCKCEICLMGSHTDSLREQHRQLEGMIEIVKKIDKPYFVLAEKKLQLGKLFDNGLLFKDLFDCLLAYSKEKYKTAEIVSKNNIHKEEFKIFLNNNNFPGMFNQWTIDALGFM